MTFDPRYSRNKSTKFSKLRHHRYSKMTMLLGVSWFFPLLMALLCIVTPTGGNPDWLQSCSVCHCNWNSGKKTADCKNKGLTVIPDDLSTEMQVVDLSNNMIPELRREEFQEANLQNLHKIFLRNCTLLELNRDALKGLTILIELDLSHNSIRVLHSSTFSGLVKLRNLVMNNNEIEVLDNYLFAELDFLSRVEFKHNRLKRIEVHAFGHLPMLSAVYLESNALTVLRKETFSRTPKLLHLSLAQNPWNCTCELQEFRDYALTHRLYTPPTDCHEPRQLRGKLWSEIPSENFACQPRILGAARTYIEAQTDNVTLPCRIDGSPRPNVTWVYNKRPINPNDQRFKVYNTLEQNRLDQSSILTSELRIFGIRGNDKGAYTCIAENRGGKAEAEIQLIVSGDYFLGGIDGIMGAGATGASASDTQSNILLIICLIATTLLLLLIIVVLVICWYCRRIKTYQKDTTMMSENGLISSKMDKTHNGSLLEGSVIMEMQKSLLTEVNPVEKPPRRTDLESIDGADDVHEIKKTLLDETQFGNHQRDDETHSVALSDTTPRSRHTYVDDGYGTSLPPDLLAFPARVPTSPSMQSSQSNIPDQIIYGIRSPLASPVYAHMTPHGIYGTTTIAAATPNGFMTLQHPKSRNLALIAAANSRQQHHQQQQSPFLPAPIVYAPANAAAVVMKQGYMTIPRKPRVPSWAPSSGTHSTQLSEFQSPTSPNPSETGTANTVEFLEPVYDNLGLRTTAGGNSTLNLHKMGQQEQPVRYTMRDRPLPATPSLNSSAAGQQLLHQQQQQQQQQQLQQQQQQQQLQQQQQQLQQQQQQQQLQLQQQHPPHQSLASSSNGGGAAPKIYEPIHELIHHPTTTSDTEPLYGTARHHSGLTIVPSVGNNIINGGVGVGSGSGLTATEGVTKVAKIPPRPPPKPKKKMSVTTTRGGQGSTSQLFEDEGEDGTEV